MMDKVTETTPISFTVDISGLDGLFEKDMEINVYRLVQESVNNIIKHSEATEAGVCVTHHDGHVRIVVSDNGKGIRSVERDGAAAAGFGMHGMVERVAILAGTMEIDSGGDKGTIVRISLPIRENLAGGS